MSAGWSALLTGAKHALVIPLGRQKSPGAHVADETHAVRHC
jgi:hypothetical protein